MAMDKQRKLVELLFKRTTDGMLEWSEALPKDTFQVSMSDKSIRIRATESLTHEDANDYEISLLNSEGKVVDTFTDNELAAEQSEPSAKGRTYRLFRELYDMARRTALGSEKILNEILSELDEEPF
jgi:hypothetical protein